MECPMVFSSKILHQVFFFTILILSSCGDSSLSSNLNSDCNPTQFIKSSVVVGDNDWIDYTKVGNDYQNANELAVAQIKIPKWNASCTGFLINENILMTNNHCIGNSTDSLNVTATFRLENGKRESFNCQQFVYTNSSLDYTLLSCIGSPGQKYGWLGLSKLKNEIGERVYAIQENCDYQADPYCVINKYVSYGNISHSQSSKVIYDLDTLPGSSGSPVFSEKNHQVLALHHAGIYATTSKQEMNEGIPMYRIRQNIESFTSVKIFEAGSFGLSNNGTTLNTSSSINCTI